MSAWDSILKTERSRISKITRQKLSESPWDLCIRESLKSIWTSTRYHSEPRQIRQLRSFKNWDDFYAYSYSRLHFEERKQVSLAQGDFSWGLVLGKEFSRISGWYRNRGIELEVTRHRYKNSDQHWRPFFNYWSKRLGELEELSTPWNKCFLGVQLSLRMRAMTMLPPATKGKGTRAWKESFKQCRVRLLVKEKRRLRGWDGFLENARFYLTIYERKKNAKEERA